jgi:ATP-dependent Clp protease ATP-binding subunit ClpB
LKRVIQKSLQDQLAEEILAGADGDTVEVGVGKDGLALKAAKSKAKAA